MHHCVLVAPVHTLCGAMYNYKTRVATTTSRDHYIMRCFRATVIVFAEHNRATHRVRTYGCAHGCSSIASFHCATHSATSSILDRMPDYRELMPKLSPNLWFSGPKFCSIGRPRRDRRVAIGLSALRSPLLSGLNTLILGGNTVH